VNFFQLLAATDNSRVNCHEMA